MDNSLLIRKLTDMMTGMKMAHTLLTKYENSSIDHYQIELDHLEKRIIELKANDNKKVPCNKCTSREECECIVYGF